MMKIIFVLLCCNTFVRLTVQVSITCPPYSSSTRFCLDVMGVWISNLTEAGGGSMLDGEAFQVTWNQEANRNTYTIFIQVNGSMMPPRNISVSVV